MNSEEAKKKIITPKTDICAGTVWLGKEKLFKMVIGRMPRKKNHFVSIRNTFQDIKMHFLSASNGVPVKEEKDPGWIFFSEQRKGPDKQKGRNITDPKSASEYLYLGEVVHVFVPIFLLAAI